MFVEIFVALLLALTVATAQPYLRSAETGMQDLMQSATSSPSLRRACLGMPGYGHVTSGASRGLWRATRALQASPPLRLAVRYQEGSLLAQNFNGLWCWALSERLAGERVDYFAMLHADIEPDDYWLDTLIGELDAHRLDIVGAVAPIKDGHGLTSLALARDDGDPWRPLCRLTLSEVHKLPETFTSDDVGHPLLINTGCWVCRFDPDWATKVYFTVNDRIVFNKTLGIYQAQVEPEDWFFSRLCHELGLRIGVTRKVGLEHVGQVRFTNRRAWGDAFDGAHVPESIVPDRDSEGFRFPHDVDGWLTAEEGRALAELAREKRVLEIGSYCGRSTICLAQTARSVTAVDYFDGRGTPQPRDTSLEFHDNCARYGVSERIVVEHPASVADGGQKGHYDLVFIDGAHDAASVRADTLRALRLLRPGGVLVFHDYREHPGEYDGRWDPGVTEVVQELLRAGCELVDRRGTLAVIVPLPQHA